MATQGRYRPDWTIGTLTLVEGEKEFTTTGSALEVAAIQPGDSIITASGLTLIIESITGQNSGTLMQPCSMLAAGTDLPLRIRYQPEGSRLAGMAASLFQMLGNGALYSLGELEGDEGQYLRFLAPGVLEAIAGENLDALAGLELVKNNIFAVDNDGKLVMIPRDKALVYSADQGLTLAEQGQARGNMGAGVLGGFRNKFGNPGLDLWQSGTSFTSLNTYTADMWVVYAPSGAGSVERVSAIGSKWGGAAALAKVYYNGTGTVPPLFLQRIEDARTFAGKRITVGVRCSDLSSANLNMTVYAQRFYGTGGNPSPNETILPTTVIGAISATGVSYLKYTFEVPDTEGKSFGSGHYLEIGFRPLENKPFSIVMTSFFAVEGDATKEADPVSFRHIQQETAICQRYYFASSHGRSAYGVSFTNGGLCSALQIYWPVRMRASPTTTLTYGYRGGDSGFRNDMFESIGVDGAIGYIKADRSNITSDFSFSYTANARL